MTTMTFQLPEGMKREIEQRVAAGRFSDADAYLQALIADDLRRAQINQMLREAEDEYEQGDYAEWRPGDSRRLLDEMLRQRQGCDIASLAASTTI